MRQTFPRRTYINGGVRRRPDGTRPKDGDRTLICWRGGKTVPGKGNHQYFTEKKMPIISYDLKSIFLSAHLWSWHSCVCVGEFVWWSIALYSRFLSPSCSSPQRIEGRKGGHRQTHISKCRRIRFPQGKLAERRKHFLGGCSPLIFVVACCFSLVTQGMSLYFLNWVDFSKGKWGVCPFHSPTLFFHVGSWLTSELFERRNRNLFRETRCLQFGIDSYVRGRRKHRKKNFFVRQILTF